MKQLNLKIFGLQCDLRWKVTYSGIKNTTQRNRKTETFPSSLITPSFFPSPYIYFTGPHLVLPSCLTLIALHKSAFSYMAASFLIGLRMESSQE